MVNLCRKKRDKKRRKRKKQKAKKRNKEKKAVENEDKISEKEKEGREKTTADPVLHYIGMQIRDRTVVREWLLCMQITGMHIRDQTVVGERLRLRIAVYLRRLIEGPVVPTRADIFLYQKFRLLGVYRRAGEVLLATRKEESGEFEVDRGMGVYKNTRVTVVCKTQQFAKIAFDDYTCRDPECPVRNDIVGDCTDDTVRTISGWVRWRYLMPCKEE